MENEGPTEKAEKKTGFWAAWVGPIAPENVEKDIRQIALAWYGVAGLNLALSTFLIYIGKFPVENILDPIVAAVGAYFIQSRKSRAVAVALFVLALSELAVTIAARIGVTDGGRNIWLAVIMVLIGWRGIKATWLFQTIHNARMNWKRVMIVSASLIGLAIVLAIISLVVLVIIIPEATDSMYGLAMIAPMLVVAVVGLALLTKKYPFAVLDSGLIGSGGSANPN